MSIEAPAVQPAPAATAAPETAPKEKESGAFEDGKMMKFAEEMNLFGEPKQQAPSPDQPPASPAPFKVLKVQGREIPVKSEEELITLAQQGVDYTQKRQRDAEWEKELRERELLIQRLEPKLSALADRVTSGKSLPGEDQGDELPPFPVEDENEISDPAALTEIRALKAQLKKHETVFSSIDKERQQQAIDREAGIIQQTFVKAREEFPFDEVQREGEDIKLSDMMFAGYVSALDKRESLRERFEPGYDRRPLQDLIRSAAQDFSFLQTKLRGSGPATVSIEALREARPDIYEKISQEAINAYLNRQAGAPSIVKPSEGEAGMARKSVGVSAGLTLEEALSRAANDPDLSGMFDEFKKGSRDIKDYGLK